MEAIKNFDREPNLRTLTQTRFPVICLTIPGLEISEIAYCKVAQILSFLNRHSGRLNV